MTGWNIKHLRHYAAILPRQSLREEKYVVTPTLPRPTSEGRDKDFILGGWSNQSSPEDNVFDETMTKVRHNPVQPVKARSRVFIPAIEQCFSHHRDRGLLTAAPAITPPETTMVSSEDGGTRLLAEHSACTQVFMQKLWRYTIMCLVLPSEGERGRSLILFE